MNALAGLMNPGAIGAGVQQAFQAGQQRRAETETRNALSGLVSDPNNTDAMATLAQYNPQAAMAMQDRQRGIAAEQAKQRGIENNQNLMRLAIGGDEGAMNELFVQNQEAWTKLDSTQRQAAEREAKIFGNAALDILNRPAEQRGSAVAAYAQQLGQEYPEVAQIAQLPPDQLESALRAAVTEAQLIDKLMQQERPSYMAIPQGGTLVDTKNPQAVQSFGQGGQPPQIQDGATATNPQTGEKIIFRNGQWQAEGGPSQSASGSFQPIGNGKAAIQSLFPQAHVTQNRRDPNSSLGRKNPRSYHVKTGAAVDMRRIPGMTFEQAKQQIERAGYGLIEAIDEYKNPSSHATGGHWHFVLGQR